MFHDLAATRPLRHVSVDSFGVVACSGLPGSYSSSMSPYLRSVIVAVICAAISVLHTGCSQPVSTMNPGSPLLHLPDSVKQFLDGQAPIIGFYAAVALDSNQLDTVQLPAWAAARAYQAIGTLWLSKGIPERDTVFGVYSLSVWSQNDFHSIGMFCGNPETYAATLNRYQLKRDMSLPIVVYRTALLLNTIAVAREINDSLGFHDPNSFICAEPDWAGGDGDDVQANFEQASVKLTYTAGYGDCQAGCAHSRSWSFRVYDSGEVRFLGASGDRPPTKAEHR